MSAGLKNKIPGAKQQLIFFLIFAFLLVADLVSKSAAFEFLADKEGYSWPVLGDFIALTARVNPGAAFSIASGNTWLLVAVSAVAVLAAVAIFELGLVKGRNALLLSVFTSGAAGNLYDRIFNDGYVRDFIDVNLYVNNYHWPTFNVADSLMCISVGLYLIFHYADENKKNKQDRS
ncbi:signal peptidase II [Sedimentisphaera salicampi]|uniref:Lipoprotein signal peptidase n=1 Tax=Sedimentisphaera salicampi TaxID=1941349 RepID=A0A1W6LQA6_9BACT|nr:signal peptidase II [Sedimentisphaera salicampi]ARN57946.1 Lipoprotein signal peptidase [Sedimentisphaera salicampi]OXU14114.1 Lipoprotein signal peptidase [Sedimentisphaera salicampi]